MQRVLQSQLTLASAGDLAARGSGWKRLQDTRRDGASEQWHQVMVETVVGEHGFPICNAHSLCLTREVSLQSTPSPPPQQPQQLFVPRNPIARLKLT